MAVVGLVAGGMVVLPYTATGNCTPTIRITAATGIGITKQIAAEGDCLTTNQIGHQIAVDEHVTA